MLWLAALLVAAFASPTSSPTTSSPTSAPTAPTKAPTTAPTSVPTTAPTTGLPKLPISKANAQYPDCRAEVIFVLEVSSSVSPEDQQTLMRFTAQFMVEAEKNLKDVRFAVVVFGIQSAHTPSSFKTFNLAPFGGSTVIISGPMGNQLDPGSELALSLDHLRYDCNECRQINKTFSQLEYLWTLGYGGGLTPTWDGLNLARLEYERAGNRTVSGRFIVLITDGVPNDGVPSNCLFSELNSTPCIRAINKTDFAVREAATYGTLLLTVGMNLNTTLKQQELVIKWASAPKDILAVPSTNYSSLQLLIPKILSVMCPTGTVIGCVESTKLDQVSAETLSIDIFGNAFLGTATLACGFGHESGPFITNVPALWRNSTWITCLFPKPSLYGFVFGVWSAHFTLDGRGYYPASTFTYTSNCSLSPSPSPTPISSPPPSSTPISPSPSPTPISLSLSSDISPSFFFLPILSLLLSLQFFAFLSNCVAPPACVVRKCFKAGRR